MKTQLGYSIVEVLVSVLVLAVGFLGMAGLQTASLQNSQKSVLRTQAAQLSYEILDRVRANKGQDYDTGLTTNDFPGTFASCVSNSCLPAQLRNFDLAQWKCSIGHTNSLCTGNALDNSLFSKDSTLPNGLGEIVHDLTTGDITITIYWYEGRDGTPNPSNLAIYDSFSLSTRI